MSIISKIVNFVKSLFGGDANTNKEAGVQIEQVSAPYKVEPVIAPDPTPTVTLDPITAWPFPETRPQEVTPVVAKTVAPEVPKSATKSKPAAKPKTTTAKPKAPAKPRAPAKIKAAPKVAKPKTTKPKAAK